MENGFVIKYDRIDSIGRALTSTLSCMQPTVVSNRSSVSSIKF